MVRKATLTAGGPIPIYGRDRHKTRKSHHWTGVGKSLALLAGHPPPSLSLGTTDFSNGGGSIWPCYEITVSTQYSTRLEYGNQSHATSCYDAHGFSVRVQVRLAPEMNEMAPSSIMGFATSSFSHFQGWVNDPRIGAFSSNPKRLGKRLDGQDPHKHWLCLTS